MTLQQELASWAFPPASEASDVPAIGTAAPHTTKLPLKTGKPTVVVFLRHCGCPFAEKTFLNLRDNANKHRDLDFYAISHSSDAATMTWLQSLPQAGSSPHNLHVIVDDTLETYRAWGLGPSSFVHVLSPMSMYSVWKLGQSEGIWNRPTESGSRWQTSGAFAVDAEGVVRWGRAAKRADDTPDFAEAVRIITHETMSSTKL